MSNAFNVFPKIHYSLCEIALGIPWPSSRRGDCASHSYIEYCMTPLLGESLVLEVQSSERQHCGFTGPIGLQKTPTDEPRQSNNTDYVNYMKIPRPYNVPT